MSNETLSTEFDDQPVSVEVDVPDDALDDFMSIFSAAEDSGGEFESLDQLLEVENVENEGVRVAWPAVPGAFVIFAHGENSRTKFAQLQREYRVSKKLGDDDRIEPAVLEGLMGKAAFGTSVKGWVLELGGKPFEFNRANFLRMWTKRRFRNFCYEQLAKLGTGASPVLEQLEKN